MPKELLQSSLRPILVNLAHHKNLTMPLLQGLARLLELLSNWFNVTLGEKLMEHLKKWLEPEKLSLIQKSWKAGEEPKIAGGIRGTISLLTFYRCRCTQGNGSCPCSVDYCTTWSVVLYL